MRFLILLTIWFFLIFPSYAYDESIKDSRVNFDKGTSKESIKININEMLNLKKIKKMNRKYASIENYTNQTSRKIFRKGKKRKRFRGTEIGDIYEKNASSVVYIGNKKGNSMGTGSLIDNKKGWIITNWHVIEKAETVAVWFKPEENMDESRLLYQPNFVGKIIKEDKRKDLALIEVQGIPKNIKNLVFGKTTDVSIGSIVYSIGHPKGETWSFNSGMVSQMREKYRWRYEEGNSWHNANVIQHEVPTNPGNSGGPLFNEKGLLVGINTFLHEGQLINFSVAVDEVNKFLLQEEKEENTQYIIKKKKPSYITKKCKDKNSYISKKKCKKTSDKKGIKKTYPDALSDDENNNGIDDTWYVDTNNNGKIDTAFIDDNEDGIIEAVLIDENENRVWEILYFDEDLDGNPDILMMDRDEDGKVDVVAYDYDQDGEWDKYEKVS
jgi:S1-C subfamily serine protease|tara:strand:+ start:977 stop:2293 length:1317 start_codon:yes stop_codon:yes gene_type:complete